METILVSFLIVLVCCLALALGQFFGREPITPKCNPGDCCLGARGCKRPSEGPREN